jgi:hypothetical protein
MVMDGYLSHLSAVMHWDIPYAWIAFGKASKAELVASMREELSFGQCRAPCATDAKITHVRTAHLRKDAVLVHGEALVSSPELTFLDLAHGLGLHKALLLGLLMCGQPQHGRAEPLTSARKIRRFLAQMKGSHGANPAIKAAKYLTDGAASAHEALLYMVLTLPPRLGGYGLAGARFNHKVMIPEGFATMAKRRWFYVDLLWEDAKLAVEYDSYQFHSDRDSRAMDAKKRTALMAMGYTVESINTAQLYDKDALFLTAQVLARRLGKRLRIRNSGFEEANKALRSLLPRNL